MKIAILSMQRVVNFGSVLQAYSLKKIINEITNDEVDFLDIDYSRRISSLKSISESIDYDSPASYPPGVFQRLKRRIISYLSAYNKNLIRKFMNDELKLEAGNNQKKYDYVVIGSDEVFNHANGVCLQLHGDVHQTRNVISYAASCGNARTEDIPAEDRMKVRAAMDNFAAISVRDDATERYVVELCENKVERHLDPVLVGELHKRKHCPVKLKKYMVIYAYGQRIRTAGEIEAIQSFAKARGLKTVAIGGSQFWCDLYIPASPFRVLDYFYFADFVITDTFHGVIFSIINKKRFAVIARRTNQEKIYSLLKDLSLTKRLVSDINKLESVLLDEIAYDEVEKILVHERERTREYLKKHLGDQE